MARSRRLHKRYRKNPSEGIFTASGSAMPVSEVWEWIGPGFAAFAAARFGAYIVTGQIEKRKPTWGRHAGAIAAIGTFAAAWLLAHRVKFLSKYVEPIVIGTGLAGVQTLFQIYLPKLGWMVGDPTVAASDQQATVAAASSTTLPEGFTELDEDPAMYDDYGGGIFGGQTSGGQQTAQAAPAQAQDSSADDLLAELDLDNGAQMGGIFAGG